MMLKIGNEYKFIFSNDRRLSGKVIKVKGKEALVKKKVDDKEIKLVIQLDKIDYYTVEVEE